MKSISTFIIAIFVFGTLFLALPEKGYSGFSMGPPCCQIGAGNINCEGGVEAIETCEGGDGEAICDFLSCTLFDDAVCVQIDDDTSSCLANTPQPTLAPIADVPTLSGWGFLSLVVVLALVGVGVILARRKHQHNS